MVTIAAGTPGPRNATAVYFELFRLALAGACPIEDRWADRGLAFRLAVKDALNE